MVDEIRSGKFHSYVGDTIVATFEGIGDGVVAVFGSHAQIDNTVAMRADRAGMIFADSDGVLRAVRTDDSRIGLVLQGAPRPDWQHASNVFVGSEQAIVADGQLPVPDAPPLPQ